MPKHTFKPEPEFGGFPETAADEKPKKVLPRIDVQLPPALLEELDVGEAVTLVLTGTVHGVSMEKREKNRLGYGNRLELSMKTAELYPTAENEFEELAESEA